MRNKINLFLACFITITSFILGYLNMFTEKVTQVTSILHGNYFEKLFNILLHNIIISIFMIVSSILLIYIGPIFMTFITFYVFGTSISAITEKPFLLYFFLKYPHFLSETIAIIIVLYISLNISKLVLVKLLGDDKPLLKNIHKEINQLKISFILLVLSAVIEGFV